MNDSSSSPNLDAGKKERFYYGWVVLVTCLILITVSYGLRFSFGVFFKSLEEEFGWNRATTSGVFSAYMVLCAVVAVLGGWAIDRYGAKIIVIVMGCFASLSLLLTSQISAPWHLFVSYSLLLAIGTGATYTIGVSAASRWFKERRALAIAIVTSGVGFGTLFMSPIASYLITGYGWRTSYMILALIAFCIMVPCSLFLRKAPSETAVPARDKKAEGINQDAAGEQNDEPEGFSLLQAIRTRSFWLLMCVWFFYSFCLFVVMTHIVRHAIDLGTTDMQAALILTFMGAANIPSRILMGIATDRFGKKRIAVICGLFMAGAMLWLTGSSSLWMLYVFAIVFGAAYGGLAPPTVAIVGDTFGLRHIGVIFGALEIGWAAGAAVGPALAGYIFDTTSSYYLAFLLGMIGMLIVVVLFPMVRAPTAKTRAALSQIAYRR